MDPAEFDRTVAAWIACAEADEDSPQHRDHFWAHDAAMEWLTTNPELVWNLIVAVYERQPASDVLTQLAAGPLEDLLEEHGPTYVDRAEALARDDRRFRSLLGGVWFVGMQGAVRRRLEAVRGAKW